jgi:HSP20 family protein
MVGYLRSDDLGAKGELDELRREMDLLARRARRPVQRGARVFPSIIISTTESNLIVRAEVPGMKLEDFDISVSDDVLTLQGIRATGEDLSGGWFHRRERESGGFSRAIRLQAEVDGSEAEASYVAGVLTVSLPLKKAAMPRQIPVQVIEG